MSFKPSLRLRRERRASTTGSLLALSVFGALGSGILAWGVTPGQDGPRPAVTVPSTPEPCPDPTVLSDPDCS